MRSLINILTGVAVAILCGAAYGQQATEERPYDARAALGYVGTSGNTEVITLNTEFLLVYRDVSWVHNFRFQGLMSRENSRGKAERYFLRNKSDYQLMDERHYLYAQGSYTDDRFSGFDYQATISSGYGRYFLQDDRYFLEGFAGIGYRQNKEKFGPEEGEAVLSLGENFNWQISETARLTQSLLTEIGDTRTISKFEIGLESNIIGQIATRIAFEARHTSEVPVGNAKTDTQTSISLVYTF